MLDDPPAKAQRAQLGLAWRALGDNPERLFGQRRAIGLLRQHLERGDQVHGIVLRGGEASPNYAAEFVAEATRLVADQRLARPVMIDCSHANSRKDHRRQGPVCREALEQVRAGSPAIMGLLIESNLEPGRQSWQPGVPLVRGVSITDACLGWDETAALLNELAESIVTRPA